MIQPTASVPSILAMLPTPATAVDGTAFAVTFAGAIDCEMPADPQPLVGTGTRVAVAFPGGPDCTMPAEPKPVVDTATRVAVPLPAGPDCAMPADAQPLADAGRPVTVAFVAGIDCDMPADPQPLADTGKPLPDILPADAIPTILPAILTAAPVLAPQPLLPTAEALAARATLPAATPVVRFADDLAPTPKAPRATPDKAPAPSGPLPRIPVAWRRTDARAATPAPVGTDAPVDEADRGPDPEAPVSLPIPMHAAASQTAIATALVTAAAPEAQPPVAAPQTTTEVSTPSVQPRAKPTPFGDVPVTREAASPAPSDDTPKSPTQRDPAPPLAPAQIVPAPRTGTPPDSGDHIPEQPPAVEAVSPASRAIRSEAPAVADRPSIAPAPAEPQRLPSDSEPAVTVAKDEIADPTADSQATALVPPPPTDAPPEQPRAIDPATPRIPAPMEVNATTRPTIEPRPAEANTPARPAIAPAPTTRRPTLDAAPATRPATATVGHAPARPPSHPLATPLPAAANPVAAEIVGQATPPRSPATSERAIPATSGTREPVAPPTAPAPVLAPAPQVSAATPTVAPSPQPIAPAATPPEPVRDVPRPTRAPIDTLVLTRIAPQSTDAPPIAAGTTAPAFRLFAAALHAARADDSERSVPATLLAPVEQPRAPTAVATTPDAALDMADQRWPHAMVARIEQLRDAAGAAADAASTSIRLVPDALGAIDVSVRTDGDTVHVHFAAEQAQTRALLADAQPRLAELADARGLKLAQADVGGGHQGQRPPAQPLQTLARAPASAARDEDTQTETTRIA